MGFWRGLFRYLVLIALALPAALSTAVPGYAESAVVQGQAPNGGVWHSYNYNSPTQDEAASSALAHCQQHAFNCYVLRQFNSTCFAMAYSSQGGFGFGFGADEHDARRAALNECMRSNPYGRCTINTAFCDNVSQAENEASEGAEREYVEHQRALERQRQEAEQRAAEEMRERVNRAHEERAREEREAQEKQAAEAQRAEAERVRRANEAEARRLAEQRVFQTNVDDCHRYVYDACTRVLSSPLASAEDSTRAREWQSVAVAYAITKQACKDGSAFQCGRALVSPAFVESDRAQITEWRLEASWIYRTQVIIGNTATLAADTIRSVAAAIQDLPLSTKIASGVAAMLALALAFVLLRLRPRSPIEASPSQAPPAEKSSTEPSLQVATATPQEATSHTETGTALVPLSEPAPEPEVQPPIDTPAALRALRIAAAYLQEFDTQADFGDEENAKTARTTLALVAKQLDIAHRADPNAALESEDVRMTQAHMRSLALALEAQTWFPHNQNKAISIIERATAADPTNTSAWFWSGWFNYEQRNRDAAIKDFERVLELDPDHMQALKFHDRAKNLGAGEIAMFKVVNARDRTLIGAEKTFNVLRIPFLIITFPFRIVYRLGRLMYVAWIDPWRAMRGDF